MQPKRKRIDTNRKRLRRKRKKINSFDVTRDNSWLQTKNHQRSVPINQKKNILVMMMTTMMMEMTVMKTRKRGKKMMRRTMKKDGVKWKM